MPRLFVGIEPPYGIKAQLLALMDGVSGARWQMAAQLHLTLRFIGDVDDDCATTITGVLAQIRYPAFSLSLAGIGAFDHIAIWAGLAPNGQLAALQQKVEHAVVEAGLAPEDRLYRPHITLARVNRSSNGVDDFLDSNKDLSSGLFMVDAFCLYGSTRTPDGSSYAIIERYLLTPP